MVSKNSQTNCILFPLHFLITLSISKLHHPLELTNQKEVSHLGVVTLPSFPNTMYVELTMA
jgi:hypothetical protein